MTYAYANSARTVRMSITVQVPVDMYDRFEREKEQQKRSMSAIANDIFAAHFEAMDEDARDFAGLLADKSALDDINTSGHGGDRYGSL